MLPPSPPKRKRISIASMLRTKLSLKAEKNWHQNSGANRREVIRVRNMWAWASWEATKGRQFRPAVKLTR